MPYALIKAGAIACVLGGFAMAGPAHAVTPFPVMGVASCSVQVDAQKGEAVEESAPDEPG